MKMTFDDLYMNNDAWEDDTLIIIVDTVTTYELEAFNADIKFQNRRVASFNRNAVLLAGGDEIKYAKICSKLS